MYTQSLNIVKKFCSIISSTIILILLLLYLPLTAPVIFGLHNSAVISESMEPAIHTGDLVYYKKVEKTDLQAGDIIVFRTSYGTDTTDITHRIVANDTEYSQVVTKGDANPSQDFAPVKYDLIKGKIVHVVPFGGRLSLYLTSVPGKKAMLGFLLPAILFRIAANTKEDKRTSQLPHG